MNLKERKESLLKDIDSLTKQVNVGLTTIERMKGAVALIDEQLEEEKKEEKKK